MQEGAQRKETEMSQQKCRSEPWKKAGRMLPPEGRCITWGQEGQITRCPFLNVEWGQEAAEDMLPPPGGLHLRGTATTLGRERERESCRPGEDPEIVCYYKFNTQTVFAKSHQHLSQEINKKY